MLVSSISTFRGVMLIIFHLRSITWPFFTLKRSSSLLLETSVAVGEFLTVIRPTYLKGGSGGAATLSETGLETIVALLALRSDTLSMPGVLIASAETLILACEALTTVVG